MKKVADVQASLLTFIELFEQVTKGLKAHALVHALAHALAR